MPQVGRAPLDPPDAFYRSDGYTKMDDVVEEMDTFGSRVGIPTLIQMGIASVVSFSACAYVYNTDPTRQEGSVLTNVLFWEITALCCSVISIGNAGQHMYQHMRYSVNNSDLKYCTLIIVFVVPFYAFCSLMAFLFETTGHASMIFNGCREFYEALVLISFMQFTIEYFEGVDKLAVILSSEHVTLGKIVPHGAHGFLQKIGIDEWRPFPIPRAPGSDFLAKCLKGIIQYSYWMVTVIAATGLIFMWGHSLKHYPLLAKLLNGAKLASSMWALFNLLVLYEYLCESKACKSKMDRIKPLSKFMCIKLIIIFSLYQEKIMAYLSVHEMLAPLHGCGMVDSIRHVHGEGMTCDWRYTADQERIGNSWVNFLVCFEMILFAQWHRYAYKYDEHLCTPEEDDDFGTGVVKMYTDIRKLSNRVSAQKRAVRMLKGANFSEEDNKKQEADLQAAFDTFDRFHDKKDNCKKVTLIQLEYWLISCGIFEKKDAMTFLAGADKDSDKSLSFREFYDCVKKNQEKTAKPWWKMW